jgi:hypothetical protein
MNAYSRGWGSERRAERQRRLRTLSALFVLAVIDAAVCTWFLVVTLPQVMQ